MKIWQDSYWQTIRYFRGIRFFVRCQFPKYIFPTKVRVNDDHLPGNPTSHKTSWLTKKIKFPWIHLSIILTVLIRLSLHTPRTFAFSYDGVTRESRFNRARIDVLLKKKKKTAKKKKRRGTTAGVSSSHPRSVSANNSVSKSSTMTRSFRASVENAANLLALGWFSMRDRLYIFSGWSLISGARLKRSLVLFRRRRAERVLAMKDSTTMLDDH